jgi:thiol-disulfide isomerase/thioredoxin/heme exporter protein D
MRRTLVISVCVVIALCSAGLMAPYDSAEGAASAERNVLFELFTATWCVGCPFADAAADQLKAEYGERVSVLQYHVQEEGISSPYFDTPETNDRATNYSVNDLPDLRVDVIERSSGAASESEAYSKYKSILDSRLKVDAPLEIIITNTTLDSGNIVVKADVTGTDSLQASSFNIVFVVYENELPYEKGILNYVVRDIAVQSASSSSLPASLSQELAYNATWNYSNMGAVVFAQVGGTGDVLQSHSTSFGIEDEDNDGLPDEWELLKLGTLLYSGEDDPDGDEITNLEEYLNRTDPLVKNSENGDISIYIWVAIAAVVIILVVTLVVVYMMGRTREDSEETQEKERKEEIESVETDEEEEDEES